MSIDQKEDWITGEEYNRERLRLIAAGVPDDDPRFEELLERLGRRNDALFERYGRPYLTTHPDQWIAIAPDGRVLIRERASDLVWDARETFGNADFASRKLNEDTPGYRLLR